MIRIKPYNYLAPNQVEWPGDSKPPFCVWLCSRGCKATQALNIWSMVFDRAEERVDPRTGQPRTVGVIFAWSEDFYMDQYGCSAIGPPPRTAASEVLAQTRLVTGPLQGDISSMWNAVKPALLLAGAKEPGTITLLPTVEAILRQLLAAQRAFA